MSHLASIERLDSIPAVELAAGDWVHVADTLRRVERVQRTRRGVQVYLAGLPLAELPATVVMFERLAVVMGRKARQRCATCGMPDGNHWDGCLG